jgi:hypothetical protein
MPSRPARETIQVRVPPPLARRLRQRARDEGNGVSALVRRFVSKALAEADRADGSSPTDVSPAADTVKR